MSALPPTHTRQNSVWQQPIPGSSSTSSDAHIDNRLRGINDRVNRTEIICRESETIAQEALGELAHQREALGRTRERIGEANNNLESTNKNLRYMHLKILTNKLLLSLIILMEVVIIGMQLYLKFRK